MDSASGKDADPAEQPVTEAGASEGDTPATAATPSDRTGGHLGLLLWMAVITIVVDQLTKWWVVSTLEVGEKYDLFWKLRINHVLNEGASFGRGASFGPLIGVIACFVGLGIIWVGRRVSHRGAAAILGLILGGAWGNLLDRLFRGDDGFLSGPVVDFVDVQFWPVWNVADMALVCGGIVLILLTAREGDDVIFSGSGSRRP